VSPRASRLNDAELVAREYASEERFLARRVAFVDYVEGPNAEDLAFEALTEAAPGRVLEVGSGTGAFDCVVALWVLHHVPDLDRGLAEVARALQPGGRLVAATFGRDHLFELYDWLDAPSTSELEFSRENGEGVLRRHFGRVERRDADATVVFPDRGALRAYLCSLIQGSDLADRLPEFEGLFRAHSSQAVFVAEKAA